MKFVPLAIAATLLTHSSPVSAMNWEGHDDWMIDQPAAMAFGAAVPEARPVGRAPACGSKGNVEASDNPYEQIPLKCLNTLPKDPDEQRDLPGPQ